MGKNFVIIRLRNADEAVDVTVHRELLCSVSPFFGRAFGGVFKEATDGMVPLTDVTEATFRIFLRWAYAQKHSSGSYVSTPDHSIFPCTAPAAKVTTPTKTKARATEA
jgi:hypothetical protein